VCKLAFARRMHVQRGKGRVPTERGRLLDGFGGTIDDGSRGARLHQTASCPGLTEWMIVEGCGDRQSLAVVNEYVGCQRALARVAAVTSPGGEGEPG
jgi:hypothetical protein